MTKLKACLDEYEILKRVSLGVFPADELPIMEMTPRCFVANTDDSGKPGRHWVAFYVPRNKELEYFDSYGKKPYDNIHFRRYIDRNFEKISCSDERLQGDYTNTCGQYALAYLFYRSNGVSMKEYIKIFDKNDYHENDHKVTEIIEYYFDYDKPLYSNNDLNQICTALGH
jgi:hypothetical protein